MYDDEDLSCIIESSGDSDGSLFEVKVSRKRKPAQIEDDDDEDSQKVSEKSMSDNEKENNDDIGILAFGEQSTRIEENLKRLKKQFPNIDEIKLQDVLISCGNKYLNACCKIRKEYNSLLAKSKDRKGWNEVNGNVWLSSGSATTSNGKKESKYFNGNRRILNHNSKSINKSSRRLESIDDSSDEEIQISYKNVNTKKGPQKKKQRIDDDSDEMDKKMLELLNNGLDCDLLTIPSVSQKKVQLLKELRPIANWGDLMYKLESHRSLSTDILTNVMQTVRSRDVVSKLMQESEKMSQKIDSQISPLNIIRQPKLLNCKCKLTSYQLYGVSWLSLLHEKNINAILADEMGLGKTIQVIALLAHLHEFGIQGPHLIVVPASTLENWVREFETWCPNFNTLLYYGSQEERAAIRAEMYSKQRVKNDVILTTYNMLNNNDDKKFFRRTKFTYIVFDEAHMLKNMKSCRYNNLLEVKGAHRLLLTGTPLQNDLLELMSLLVFTMPSLFLGEINHIKCLFACSRQSSQTAFEKERVIQAKKILRPFILRRLKTEVLKDLPIKTEFIERCQMTPQQEQYYMDLVEKYTREICYKKKGVKNGQFDDKFGTFKGSQGMLMELRKAANHPLLLRVRYSDSDLRQMAKLMLNEPTHRDANEDYIFEDMSVCSDFELHNLCLAYPSINKFKLEPEDILESGKFKVLDRLLPEVINSGKRVLLFSQFVIVLDIIAEYLKIRKYKFLRLDGSTKVAERLSLIDEFTDDTSIPIFLLSTKAGGLGINLTAAQVVIIHDIDFNPYNDKQAEDRCHRVGQTKDVFVYRLISDTSVEEGMLRIGEEKLKLGKEICSNEKEAIEQEQRDVKNLLHLTLQI
ncbi:SWI/SNF-related matrix-associated actin-dependent regulator of chromatin subfamily A containing DEAD/H box 1-like isoform X3 [Leptotrombidium deliense]|uniref:SWI/SNF-related matrix-associated actin-dependent regulator of chromatin subfamily A containing DEAD/H box 1 homolog n=1 Tax=Leptotrombidium deliense TaxID=299467 RepID=A0A443SUZ3_9ACAR|nr:SWI/SNF-related matrix-associated actin-dependent regulator of chromatin subfamily A containing DEAD/H box 1-like isoform X3 [Leptotrombidium deliense]